MFWKKSVNNANVPLIDPRCVQHKSITSFANVTMSRWYVRFLYIVFQLVFGQIPVERYPIQAYNQLSPYLCR